MSSFHVVLAAPSTGHCRTQFAFSLARLVGYLSRVKPLPELTDWGYTFSMLEGSSISTNRERIVRQSLADPKVTHLCFMDDDMGFAHDVLHIMAGRRLPLVACNYRMRVPPAEFTATRYDLASRMETTEKSTGLEQAAFTGFGCCLIERSVLEAVPEPRFPILWRNAELDYTTEDLPFFDAVNKLGIKAYVDHDASKRVWHNGNINYVYNENYEAHSGSHGIAPTEALALG